MAPDDWAAHLVTPPGRIAPAGSWWVPPFVDIGIPPVTLLNTFDGGTGATSGATISAANTDGPGNTPLNQVSVGASATATLDSVLASDGALSALFTTPVTATTAYVSWTAAWGTQTTTMMWADVYLTASPGANLRIFGALVDAATLGAIVVINTSRQILIANSAGSTVYTSAINAVPTGQWCRLEFGVTHNASTGTAQVKVYNSTASAVADVDSGQVAGLNTGAQSTIVRYGIGQSGASLTARLDRIGASNAIVWGQASTSITTDTAALTAAGSMTASAVVLVPAAATLSAGGTLTAAGGTAGSTVDGSAALAAAGSLAAAAVVRVPAAASLAAAGTLTAAGSAIQPAGAALTAAGTLTAVGVVRQLGTATLTAAGTLTAAIGSTSSGTASLVAAGTLTASGTARANGAATISAAGTLTAAGQVRVVGSASLTATSTLSAAGTVRVVAGAALAGVGAVAAVGAVPAPVGAVTVRPITGTTARPGGGTTVRPNTGATTRGTGTTVRPFTTTTARP